MLNPTVTKKYFDALTETLTSLKLDEKPNCAWNMDETSVSLAHRPTRFLDAKEDRNVPSKVGNSRSL
ncbi:hypothetical protein DPMN_100140 [Dreissena polymorpha]|uniref:Uncharacterized protein n=1 Tax=Dreissena polymorpha TaxID=45954 RepID=A0A9D4LIL8_DREPO|nr:hypothetical protein DPMN_100140 [Dreissena polymorpha]